MNDIIDDYTYKSYKEEIDKELLQLNVNLKSQSKKISNFDDFVNSIIVFSQNISKYWLVLFSTGAGLVSNFWAAGSNLTLSKAIDFQKSCFA